MKLLIFSKSVGKGVCQKIFLPVLLFFLSLQSSAQQPQVYNQFFMNPYVYNPAYAGVEGHTVLFLMYRQQWTSITGAPQTMHASFHVPLKGGIAIGSTAFNTTQGLLNTSAGKVTVGYLLNVDRTHFIRFGLSIGGGVNSVNVSHFDSPSDPAFDNFLDQNSFLIGDFGMTYHFNHFNLGFSIPNLFTYDVVTQTEFAPIAITPLDNVLFKMNYRGHITDDFAIEPHLVYRYSQVIPHQFEGTIITHLKHTVWVGASYRQDAGIIGLAGIKAWEKLGIGFAYELGNPDISADLGPTFEVKIGYHLGIKKDHAKHVSSFIKSHRLTAEERAKKAELERQRQLAELQNGTDTQNDADALEIADTSTPTTGTTPETTNEPVYRNDTGTSASTPKATDGWVHQGNSGNLQRVNQSGEEETGIRFEKDDDVVLSWVSSSQANDLKAMPDGHLERTRTNGTKEIGINYQKTNPDGTVEQVIKWDRVITPQQAEAIVKNPGLTAEQHNEIAKGNPGLTQDFRTHKELGSSDDHVVVRRGNHLLELPSGNFVIAGAFGVFENAQTYSDRLFQQGYHEVIVGYSSARGYYYVVVFQSGNINQARGQRDKMRTRTELSRAWVLQVTE